jgi:hypothetical protein
MTARKKRVFTIRGFEDFCEFRDRYGSLVTVRESSLATLSCVWIFCKDNPDIPEPSPHLTVEQAQIVIKALQAFVRKNKS